MPQSERKKIIVWTWEEDGDLEFHVEAPKVNDTSEDEQKVMIAAVLAAAASALDPDLRVTRHGDWEGYGEDE